MGLFYRGEPVPKSLKFSPLDGPAPPPYNPPLRFGAVAQLGERLVRNEEASGSIPLSSTILLDGRRTDLTSPCKSPATPHWPRRRQSAGCRPWPPPDRPGGPRP